ncbi:MAG: hypothetical protein GXX96_30000 [Planctomycetaceae bacterium]|nr:hypothetical protein [Planctomycetaceae bacterium]
MDITRNQYFLAGLVLIFLGLEFRAIESMQLTQEFTQFLARRTNHPAVATTDTVDSVLGTNTKLPPKTITPPEWVGYSFLSLGAVLVLHSLAMPKPG